MKEKNNVDKLLEFLNSNSGKEISVNDYRIIFGMLVGNRKFREAKSILKDMRNKFPLDVGFINLYFDFLLKNGREQDVYSKIKEIEEKNLGCLPLYFPLIDWYGRFGGLSKLKTLFKELESLENFEHPTVLSRFITSFCKCGSLDEALELEKRCSPELMDPTSWFEIIDLCIKNSQEEKIQQFISKLLKWSPSVTVYDFLIRVALRLKDEKLFFEVKRQAEENGEMDIILYNQIFKAYFVFSKFVDIEGILKEMKQNNVIPDKQSFIILMELCLKYKKLQDYLYLISVLPNYNIPLTSSLAFIICKLEAFDIPMSAISDWELFDKNNDKFNVDRNLTKEEEQAFTNIINALEQRIATKQSQFS